ncbi:MAG: hypothetical protein LBR00_01235 [Clostridiales Family XIII bacterium]|jgi:hypothetical protein|nr:hypothetical protein [Clostridiales Family XIII bacterium]
MKVKAQIESAAVSGEGEVSVAEDGFTLSTLFDTAFVPWSEVGALAFEDYTLTVAAAGDAYRISKLGADGEPLYNHMLAAYNDKVRACLFVGGEPAVTASANGVPVEVYGDCVVTLPPDLGARRVPLAFATGFRDEDYTVTIDVADGSSYAFSKLGYDTAPFSKAVQEGIKALREQTIAQIGEIDKAITPQQSAKVARLMPLGAAAPMGAVRAVAPTLADALEERLAQSRAAETYPAFRELCDPDEICVGFRKVDSRPDFSKYQKDFSEGALPPSDGSQSDPASPEGEDSNSDFSSGKVFPGSAGGGLAGMLQGGGMSDIINNVIPREVAESTPDSYILWLIAPVAPGVCAVEFAGGDDAAAATFVYRYGDAAVSSEAAAAQSATDATGAAAWDAFRLKLNMALEAIDFKREVIRLTDEELREPEYELYRMASDRNEALRTVRAHFAGRAIHRSMDSWKKQLQGL